MAAATTPAPSLLANLRDELQRHLPFGRMAPADVQAFVAAARETYHAPGEAILQAGGAAVGRLFYLRRGQAVRRGRDGAPDAHIDAGDLFPVAALLGQRPVGADYEAVDDCFCLEVPAAAVQQLLERSPAFADFLNGRVQQFLALSRQALQASAASQTLADLSMEAPLASLPRRELVACAPDAPLGDALRLMQQRRVGSVLVLDAAGGAVGIFTRHDVLERVALGQPPMDTPIAGLMSAPVRTLDAAATVQDALLLMSRHGVRHVPFTERGRVLGIVSERDLFARQRLSLRQISGALRAATDLDTVVRIGPRIREFARALLAQGLSARALTGLVSHLNDELAGRVVELAAQAQGCDLRRACWLAFGSEGRGEQTIATDQDNGLVFVSDDPEADRDRWLALGRRVNQTLDACGYPLCKGGIMAGNPACCLTPLEWQARFERWIDQGAPEDLLNASIYFDFRAIAGDAALAGPMREFVLARARATPRFTKQLAENALRTAPKLNWRGALDPQHEGRHEWIDLKLHGTMVFVDAARLYALAHGVAATGTRERLEAVAPVLRADAREAEAWIGAFEFLQMLRLRTQVDEAARAAAGDNPNRLDVATLNDIDRRILREAFRVGQRLQQRMSLDYLR
jgi:CBS domain-containing protein